MRAACWTCRSRTIQCDRTSTPCAKCKKAGLQCFDKRPLRWVQGVAIRGKMRGRLLQGESTASNQSSLPQVQGKQVSHLSAKSTASNSSPMFALQDPCIKDLDFSSRFYLDYYNAHVAKLYILYDSESNPFRTLLSYATNDSTLQQSIVALAARHFANTGRSFDQADDAVSYRFVNANLDALHFKQQTIKQLSLSLSHPQPVHRDSLMATILLLIFLDLLECGSDGWKYHLQGAQVLANISRSLLKPGASENANSHREDAEEETRRFIARQFSLVSTIGGAFSASNTKHDLSVHFDTSRHQESIIRSFLGCPEFLLRTIGYFSNKRHILETLDVHEDISSYDHLQDSLTMLELTADFDPLQWASDAMSPRAPSRAVGDLSLLAEAYKTAAMLYGNRVLCTLSTSIGTMTPDNSELVQRLLDVIESLKGDMALFKCLLWPTFIAGLECYTEHDKTLVLGYLRELWNLTCCLNVINASKILHHHWQRKHPDSTVSESATFHISEQGWLLI